MLTRRTLINSIALAAASRTKAESVLPSDMVLWYSKPADRWLDSLPIGNGRLGAMVFGGTARERIALNESTVWSGGPSDDHENPTALAHLGETRRLFFEGKYIEARDLCKEHLLGRQGTYGTHLPLADLWLEWKQGGVQDYRRSLDLNEGVVRVEYSAGGARFVREYVASNPDDVIVIRMSANKPGRITFAAGLDGGSLPSEVRTEGGRILLIDGQALEKHHSDGKTGVRFEARLQMLARGGKTHASGNQIMVEDADSVTLLIAANTDYRGRNPESLCRKQLAAASSKSWYDLRRRHVSDYQKLYQRVNIKLGGPAGIERPTDERLAAVRAGKPDPQLSALFFQYSRYLLIAGSRQDSPLPMNLQGIWNDNLACNMGWTCDFHLDINTQQNYWHAESANLAECHQPLFGLIESIRVSGRKTARKTYGSSGWVCHVFTNAWGYTAPGWGLGWGLHPTGGIWLASHLWEHYRYTRDRDFLATRAYPVLKEAAEFFLAYLVEHPKYGWLVTGPAVSPENAFLTPDGKPCSESMGPTCDRVLVNDLFASCIEASLVLGVDEDFRAKIEAARAKLPPLRVGRHGQLEEWLDDFEEAVPNHRHTTHLIALHPSNQITPRSTPALAKAARVTIERRTGQKNWEDVEWSRANLINFFARLGDGETAHRHLLGLLGQDADNNLLTFSRGGIAGAPQNIFAIDGNSAGACGIVEMLLQSHTGEVHLLPALPAVWAAGSVKGLRARGGFEVSIDWRQSTLSSVILRSITGTTATVRYGNIVARVDFKPGETVRLNGDLNRS